MSEIVVVHGYVGSGKSTQCSRLESEGLDGVRVQHISAGNRLRAIRTETETSGFSQYINALDAPSPLPDWVVEGIMLEPLDSSDGTLALIDGYPRHPEAVESFHEAIQRRHHKLLGTIAMQLPMDISIDRIVARGKRDGEKLRGGDMREFAEYRYRLDMQTTNLAIDALNKIALTRSVDATGDLPTVYSRFVEEVRFLRKQNN